MAPFISSIDVVQNAVQRAVRHEDRDVGHGRGDILGRRRRRISALQRGIDTEAVGDQSFWMRLTCCPWIPGSVPTGTPVSASVSRDAKLPFECAGATRVVFACQPAA